MANSEAKMRDKLVLLLVIVLPALAQWQPDQRLTNDPHVSSTSGVWCVAAAGDTVHVVWTDNRDGNDEIYYKCSTDGGATWGSDMRLTNEADQSSSPSIAVTDAVVHVAWWDHRDGNREIYYKRSTDGGATWGSDTRLTNAARDSDYPSVAAAGAVVHVVWREHRDGDLEVYYKRSTDGGASWDSDVRLTNAAGSSSSASVAVSEAAVHVVWQDNRDGSDETYYKRSTDGGATWSSDVRLTSDSGWSWNASVAAAGAVVHVVWQDVHSDHREIRYERSTDGGATWGDDMRLTERRVSSSPSIASAGADVHVVWRDYCDGDEEVYYKRSSDGGATWGGDTRLTNAAAFIECPSIAAVQVAVHVLWQDYRDGNDEVYYKRNPTGIPATVEVATPNGDEAWLAGTTRKISWTHGGAADLDSIWYSIDSGSTWTFVAEQLPAATSYMWRVPNTPTARALVRVKAVCAAASAVDQSDATFAMPRMVLTDGWRSEPTVPGAARVQAGGGLAFCADNGLIYEMKGNKTLEFASYNPEDSTWTALAPIPAGEKPVRYGGSIAAGAGKVFITKGNNTLEFCRYDIAAGAWLPATVTVPIGWGDKVKGGTSMVFVHKADGDFVYLLKSGWCEFYKYDVARDTFVPAVCAPIGYGGQYGPGSWIAYDGSRYIYCHKAKSGELYKYDVLLDNWTTSILSPMPLAGDSAGRLWKPVADGSSAAWGNGALYAFKGGNTQQFWKYLPPPMDTWTELSSIPRASPSGGHGRKVKAGAALVYYPNDGVLYAMKGNRSNQFWMYRPGAGAEYPTRPEPDGVAASGKPAIGDSRLSISPNPLKTGYANLRCSLPIGTKANMSIYDALGRTVLHSTLVIQNPTSPLDTRGLAAGVYVVKLSWDGFQASQKIVVER
jgi:hypothetical protein